MLALLPLAVVLLLSQATDPGYALAPRTAAERLDRASVIVGIVDELEGDPEVSAMVLRRASLSPHDVILLRRADASGVHLAAAVAMLMLQRDRAGTVPPRDQKIVLRGGSVPPSWRGNWLPRFESVVSRLRRGTPQHVAGIGRVPAEVLILPEGAAHPTDASP